MAVKWRKSHINFEVTLRIRNSFLWTLGSLRTVPSTCLHFLVYSYIEWSLNLNSHRRDLQSAEVPLCASQLLKPSVRGSCSAQFHLLLLWRHVSVCTVSGLLWGQKSFCLHERAVHCIHVHFFLS